MSTFAPIPGYATTRRTVVQGTGRQGRHRHRARQGNRRGDEQSVLVHQGSGTKTLHLRRRRRRRHHRCVQSSVSPRFASTDTDARVFAFAFLAGWDQGCLGARVGEIIELNIPAHEGYGAGGFPAWGIPPNGTLLFEIEVLAVRGK